MGADTAATQETPPTAQELGEGKPTDTSEESNYDAKTKMCQRKWCWQKCYVQGIPKDVEHK